MIDAAVGGTSATVGVVGGVAGAAHQATVTTVDQTQIITLQVGALHDSIFQLFHSLFLWEKSWIQKMYVSL